MRLRGRAVARLGKLKLTPQQKSRRSCGISFSLSKRAELALATLCVSEPRPEGAVAARETVEWFSHALPPLVSCPLSIRPSADCGAAECAVPRRHRSGTIARQVEQPRYGPHDRGPSGRRADR